MKIVVPVSEYRGFDSAVHGHFGSAPCFALVDTDRNTVEMLGNRDHDHVHGACNPLKSLEGCGAEAIIVGGIGLGALMGLRSAGLRVYRAESETLSETVNAFLSGKLEEQTQSGACQGHGECHHG